MEEQQRHEMVFEQTDRLGAEEWYCPTWGRRMLVNWEPKFKKIILEVGDEYALHSGSKGGLQLGSVQVMSVDDLNPGGESQPLDEDFRLTPWVRWLNDVNFENLWDSDS